MKGNGGIKNNMKIKEDSEDCSEKIRKKTFTMQIRDLKCLECLTIMQYCLQHNIDFTAYERDEEGDEIEVKFKEKEK